MVRNLHNLKINTRFTDHLLSGGFNATRSRNISKYQNDNIDKCTSENPGP